MIGGKSTHDHFALFHMKENLVRMKANLPTENAREPEENAHQPMLKNMPPVLRGERKVNNNFADDARTDSQSGSSSKEALSQPANSLTHRQKLFWLQKRRSQGLWVQCDDCNRWRYLPSVLDKHELPKKWYCKMNPDATFASCSSPEIPLRIHEEEDIIYSEYTAGSLVVARLDGWPWWPAMVDDCPDTEQYYWLDGFSDIPTHYHVVFFDAYEVTRAWLAPSQLQPYVKGKKILNTSLKNKTYKKRLDIAITQANDAQTLQQASRLSKYSFVARYKGTILSPNKINKNEIKKYKGEFERKFSIKMPDDFSDSESEVDESGSLGDTPIRRNVITLGSKRRKTDEAVKSNMYSNDIVTHSLVVQVDTNSDLDKGMFSNDLSATFVPDISAQLNTLERSEERPVSPTSDDFDFCIPVLE